MICTILQFLTFELYNKRFHPFIDLVKEVKDYKIEANDENSNEDNSGDEVLDEERAVGIDDSVDIDNSIDIDDSPSMSGISQEIKADQNQES